PNSSPSSTFPTPPKALPTPKNTDRSTKHLKTSTGPRRKRTPRRTRRSKHPSLLPPRHYCDITGLEVRIARPGLVHGSTHGAQVHDKSVYDLIKNLSPGVAKYYLSARGVNPIVK
ncbi:hypothetical protein OG21DRAFT_1435699, partial [Imleria badia]